MWEAMCVAWPASERLYVVFFASTLHAICFFGSSALFVLADRLHFWDAYRLPRDRPDLKADTTTNLALNQRALWESVLGAFVIVPVLVYVAFPGIASVVSICDAPLPPPSTWLKDILLQIVGCDFMFYWVHRGLHESPWLYRNIHKQHHEFKASTVWASEFFGVIDFALNVLPGIVPALVLRSHFAVLMLFTALRQWQTVQSHSGFDLPFDPFNRGVFHGGCRRHDFHHSHNHGCYSDFLPFWDWLCGTDRAYKNFWVKHEALAAYPI